MDDITDWFIKRCEDAGLTHEWTPCPTCQSEQARAANVTPLRCETCGGSGVIDSIGRRPGEPSR